jgi:RAT1-interacting protein
MADQKLDRRLSEDEPDSPPRKRPRTKAPPQMTAPNADTIDFAMGMKPRPEPAAIPLPTPMASPETHRFSIQPLNRFQGASASIKRPREVAHFSYDGNHEYRDDESSINYYVPPPMGADLKEGFDTFKHYEDKEDPHLDSLLRALIHKESKDASAPKTKADFVTWRGMMTKVS